MNEATALHAPPPLSPHRFLPFRPMQAATEHMYYDLDRIGGAGLDLDEVDIEDELQALM